MLSFLHDLRYAFRTLRKTPGVTVVAVLALTLGIGLTTGAFSIVYGALMRGLPYPGADRMAVLYRSNVQRGIERQSLPVQDVADYAAQQHSFTAMGAYTTGTVSVSGSQHADRYDGGWMTASAFRIMGVQPVLGRTFRAEETAQGGARVVVLGNAIWRDRFGGDASVLDRTIRVNGQPYTVIGVMPPGFDFPDGQALWLPLQMNPLGSKRGEGEYVTAIGQLKPGVTMDAAAVDAGVIGKRLAARYPETNGGFTAGVATFVDWSLGPEPRRVLYTMLGAVFAVLLIACTNVANLLLSRAVHRTREVGVRTALGATRAAVVRQFMAEAVVLSAGSVALGLGVAQVWIIGFGRAIEGTGAPSFIQLGLYPPVLLFAASLGVIATFASGVMPAIQSSRMDVNAVLKDDSRGTSSMHIGKVSRALVVFEIALSCALLVPAGLMIKSVVQMRTMQLGFSTKDVFTARVGFPTVYTDTVQQKRFFTQLEQRVSAVPGVRAAALSGGLPGAQQGLATGRFAVEGASYAADTDYPTTRATSVTPGFFAALDIPVQQGRLFADADRESALPVAVVTHRFVERYLKGKAPIGQRIRFGTSRSTQPWLTIVGVVRDIFGGDPDDPTPPVVFRPLAQAHTNFVYIAARTAAPPAAVTGTLRSVVASLDPDIPIYWPMTLAQAIDKQLWYVRVFGAMFSIFGAIALLLGAVGLYAVMSFSVSRRTREVGIRMALGARRAMVVRLMVSRGLVQLGVGLVLGLLIAIGISRFVSDVLFDVQPRDPLVFAAVTATLVLTGLFACVVPSLRALRVDPVTALRNE